MPPFKTLHSSIIVKVGQAVIPKSLGLSIEGKLTIQRVLFLLSFKEMGVDLNQNRHTRVGMQRIFEILLSTIIWIYTFLPSTPLWKF